MTMEKQDIESFKQLFLSEFGRDLTNFEAQEKAHSLINLVRLLMQETSRTQ